VRLGGQADGRFRGHGQRGSDNQGDAQDPPWKR
jgi:hypothetical protein